jgi:hypothetical protein
LPGHVEQLSVGPKQRTSNTPIVSKASRPFFLSVTPIFSKASCPFFQKHVNLVSVARIGPVNYEKFQIEEDTTIRMS